MKRLRTWFQGQQRRDQLALTLLALALLVYVLIQSLLRPLHLAVDTAAERVAMAEQGLVKVKALATQLAQQRSGAASSGQRAGLSSLVDSSSAALGLQLTSLEPSADGSSAAVRLEDVALSQLLRWLQSLQQQQISVESLDLMPGRQQGQVNAVLRLGGGN